MWLYRGLVVTLVLFWTTESLGFFFLRRPASPIGVVRKAVRYSGVVPWLGTEIVCNGCPAHSCEDDAAIIHGYCCGCALRGDRLPVTCAAFLKCPLNPQALCHDYEFMMRCCC